MVPKLSQVFDLFDFKEEKSDDQKIFINIEVKVPDMYEHRRRYDWNKMINMVHELIQDRGVAKYCLVSSFNNDALTYMESINR